jgi:hypothetical protein
MWDIRVCIKRLADDKDYPHAIRFECVKILTRLTGFGRILEDDPYPAEQSVSPANLEALLGRRSSNS